MGERLIMTKTGKYAHLEGENLGPLCGMGERARWTETGEDADICGRCTELDPVRARIAKGWVVTRSGKSLHKVGPYGMTVCGLKPDLERTRVKLGQEYLPDCERCLRVHWQEVERPERGTWSLEDDETDLFHVEGASDDSIALEEYVLGHPEWGDAMLAGDDERIHSIDPDNYRTLRCGARWTGRSHLNSHSRGVLCVECEARVDGSGPTADEFARAGGFVWPAGDPARIVTASGADGLSLIHLAGAGRPVCGYGYVVRSIPRDGRLGRREVCTACVIAFRGLAARAEVGMDETADEFARRGGYVWPSGDPSRLLVGTVPEGDGESEVSLHLGNGAAAESPLCGRPIETRALAREAVMATEGLRDAAVCLVCRARLEQLTRSFKGGTVETLRSAARAVITGHGMIASGELSPEIAGAFEEAAVREKTRRVESETRGRDDEEPAMTVARLRKQNKESSDRWGRRVAALQSERDALRAALDRGLEAAQWADPGLHRGHRVTSLVAGLLARAEAAEAERDALRVGVAELRQVVDNVTARAERYRRMLLDERTLVQDAVIRGLAAWETALESGTDELVERIISALAR